MKDRLPRYPGRVKLNPVAGQVNTYDMVRADQPIEEGTAVNKAALLSDDTAAVLGMTGDPTINDALLKIALGTGKFAFAVTVKCGTVPLPGLSISGITTTSGATPITDANGYALCVSTSPSSAISIGQQFADIQPFSTTLQAGSGIITRVVCQLTKKTSDIDVTSSQTLTFSPATSHIDVFAVGGGGAGAAYQRRLGGSGGMHAGGGGGGFTKAVRGYALAKDRTVKVLIGAGASAVTVSSNNASGGGGGKTTVSNGLVTIIEASGGGGGSGSGPGGSGGSAGGSAYTNNQDASLSSGGSDGSDSRNPGDGSIAKGQGTTTRKFGEAANALYSGGGGGASFCWRSSDDLTISGPGGAGGGGRGQNSYVPTAKGSDATFYGGGGGGVTSNSDASQGTASISSGAGYQGFVSVRCK